MVLLFNTIIVQIGMVEKIDLTIDQLQYKDSKTLLKLRDCALKKKKKTKN